MHFYVFWNWRFLLKQMLCQKNQSMQITIINRRIVGYWLTTKTPNLCVQDKCVKSMSSMQTNYMQFTTIEKRANLNMWYKCSEIAHQLRGCNLLIIAWLLRSCTHSMNYFFFFTRMYIHSALQKSRLCF